MRKQSDYQTATQLIYQKSRSSNMVELLELLKVVKVALKVVVVEYVAEKQYL